MTQSIAQQLESAYAQAALQETAKRIETPKDWQRFRDIQQRSAQTRQREQESFRQDYPARLADAREAVLKERAARHYTHPAPQSATRQDRFNKDQIERQAHLRVHYAHHQTLAKIDVQENREVKQLLEPRQTGLSPQFKAANQSQQHLIKRER